LSINYKYQSQVLTTNSGIISQLVESCRVMLKTIHALHSSNQHRSCGSPGSIISSFFFAIGLGKADIFDELPFLPRPQCWINNELAFFEEQFKN
jgi:hypothetical protein